MWAGGRPSASTLSMRAWHACHQAAKSVIGFFGLEGLRSLEREQGAVFENLYLLFRIGQLLAAILQQFGTALVRSQRGFQRPLAGFHFSHDGFPFGPGG